MTSLVGDDGQQMAGLLTRRPVSFTVGGANAQPRLAAVSPGSTGLQQRPTGGDHMWLWILLLIVVIIVFGLGFVVKWLFYVAAALFLVWLIMVLVNGIGRRS